MECSHSSPSLRFVLPSIFTHLQNLLKYRIKFHQSRVFLSKDPLYTNRKFGHRSCFSPWVQVLQSQTGLSPLYPLPCQCRLTPLFILVICFILKNLLSNPIVESLMGRRIFPYLSNRVLTNFLVLMDTGRYRRKCINLCFYRAEMNKNKWSRFGP